ncbi:MAG: histidine kinase [Thiohalophilus sp.]|uniref:ATP-binding protein n=1 Tax=Thiohalophilus sp. TaxID=3028392 RepID=UPI00286FDE03|nr:ATP-binding protein [Thiohalophilus sp.]MDR9436411.1 histidine kinase [Thiohalophilus sp.]
MHSPSTNAEQNDSAPRVDSDTQAAGPELPPRDGIWRSRLCGAIFGIGAILIVLGIASAWLLYTHHAGSTLVGIILALLFGGLGLIGILIILVQRTLLRPLTQLRHWAGQLRQGNLSARLPGEAPNEFRGLFADFNTLADELEMLSLDMQSQVRKQTKHIERKTHSLEIIYDVAASINISRDLDDLLTRFLHTLKEVVNARAAVVRLVDNNNQMRLVSSIGLDDDLIKREQLIPSEQCLCGSSFSEGKVLFQTDLRKCDKIIGRSFFDSDDIGMIVVPLQYRGKTLGVYNLFVSQEDFAEPDDIEDLLTSIGRHLGMAIDKARSEDEAQRLSIMEERTRLAHELHDSLAQTLASLRFQVRVLDETIRQGEEPSVWYELEKIENNLDEAYAELRELITHFRAPIDKRGLVPAVEHLVDRFRNQSEISIYLQKEWNVLYLPASVEVQALRIIQEALNNIRKHSQAHTVRVIMRSDVNGDCRILIEDDGVGMNIQPSSDRTSGDHLGLSIMDERAKRIGGTVRIESEPNEGTRVLLHFRYPEVQTVEVPVQQQG